MTNGNLRNSLISVWGFSFFLCPCLIKKKKQLSVFSSLRRFDSRSPSGFRADLCEGPDKAEQGLVMQAWGSTGEIIIRRGIHWRAPFYSTGQAHIPRRTLYCTACTYTHWMIMYHATLTDHTSSYILLLQLTIFQSMLQTFLKDKFAVILYFSYCQRILWKDRNQMCLLSNFPTLSLALSPKPTAPC